MPLDGLLDGSLSWRRFGVLLRHLPGDGAFAAVLAAAPTISDRQLADWQRRHRKAVTA